MLNAKDCAGIHEVLAESSQSHLTHAFAKIEGKAKELDWMLSDLDALVAYSWADEERDYFALPQDERENHIYESLERLRDALERITDPRSAA